MRAAKDAGVTVLLDGQGGDELLGGYEGTSGWTLRSQGPGAVIMGIAADRSELGAVARSLAADRLPRFAIHAYRRRLGSPYAPAELVRSAARVEPEAADWGVDGGPVGHQLRSSSSTPAFRTCCATPTATAWPTAARSGCLSSTDGWPSWRCPFPLFHLPQPGLQEPAARRRPRPRPGVGSRPAGQNRVLDPPAALARRARGPRADRRGAARPRHPGARRLRNPRDRGGPALGCLARPGRDLACPLRRAVAAADRRLEGRGAGGYRPEALDGSPGRGLEYVPATLKRVEHPGDRPGQRAEPSRDPKPESGRSEATANQRVLDRRGQPDGAGRCGELGLLESGALECPSEPLGREVGPVARQVQLVPAAAETPPLPAAEVRNRNEDQSPGAKGIANAAQGRHRIGDMLQRVAEDRGIVGARLQFDVVESSLAGIHATRAGRFAGVCGRLDPNRLPAPLD